MDLKIRAEVFSDTYKITHSGLLPWSKDSVLRLSSVEYLRKWIDLTKILFTATTRQGISSYKLKSDLEKIFSGETITNGETILIFLLAGYGITTPNNLNASIKVKLRPMTPELISELVAFINTLKTQS